MAFFEQADNGLDSAIGFGLERYHSSGSCAKQLGVSPMILSKITSQIFVNPGHLDVGLNLKFQKQNLMLPGYTRRPETQQRFGRGPLI